KQSINFTETYDRISDFIDSYDFVSAEDIILSYENNGELVKGNSVRSYLAKGVLYYKGSWNNQLTLYSLIPEIASLINIKDLENELRVLLLSDIPDIRTFLFEELGINVFEAVSRVEFSKSVERTKGYVADEDDIDTLVGYHDYSDERSRIE